MRKKDTNCTIDVLVQKTKNGPVCSVFGCKLQHLHLKIMQGCGVCNGAKNGASHRVVKKTPDNCRFTCMKYHLCNIIKQPPSQTRSKKNDCCSCLDTTVALIYFMSNLQRYVYNMAKCSKNNQGNHNFMSFWKSLWSFPNSIELGKVAEGSGLFLGLSENIPSIVCLSHLSRPIKADTALDCLVHPQQDTQCLSILLWVNLWRSCISPWWPCFSNAHS